ncbi:MAG: transcriptional repressor [Pseudomonadota bacterium]
MTKQRRVILEEIMKVQTHPTADDVFRMVRKRLPNISLGTVYRNLEFLAEHDMIQSLEYSSAQKRFDGITDNHYHVRCKVCGSVADVPMEPISGIEQTAAGSSEYEIVTHRLEFIGVCPGCRRRSADGCAKMTP